MNLKMQNLDHVKILAELEAKATGQEQVIIKAMDGRYEVFKYLPAKKWNGSYVVRVGLADRKVLPDNGGGKPEPADKKGKGKRKRTKR